MRRQFSERLALTPGSLEQVCINSPTNQETNAMKQFSLPRFDSESELITFYRELSLSPTEYTKLLVEVGYSDGSATVRQRIDKRTYRDEAEIQVNRSSYRRARRARLLRSF